MSDPSDDLSIETRDGLPEALRVLADAYPREVWEGHQNFSEMTRFWMERHLMFRRVLHQLTHDAERVMDRQLAVEHYRPRLSRYGGFFLQQLHAHHTVEDQHYFPRLMGLDPRIERGFGMLEEDHHALDGWLNRFADSANAVLGDREEASAREAAGKLLPELKGFRAMLDRHLTDEEELVVPVILDTGFRE